MKKKEGLKRPTSTRRSDNVPHETIRQDPRGPKGGLEVHEHFLPGTGRRREQVHWVLFGWWGEPVAGNGHEGNRPISCQNNSRPRAGKTTHDGNQASHQRQRVCELTAVVAGPPKGGEGGQQGRRGDCVGRKALKNAKDHSNRTGPLVVATGGLRNIHL